MVSFRALLVTLLRASRCTSWLVSPSYPSSHKSSEMAHFFCSFLWNHLQLVLQLLWLVHQGGAQRYLHCISLLLPNLHFLDFLRWANLSRCPAICSLMPVLRIGQHHSRWIWWSAHSQSLQYPLPLSGCRLCLRRLWGQDRSLQALFEIQARYALSLRADSLESVIFEGKFGQPLTTPLIPLPGKQTWEAKTN